MPEHEEEQSPAGSQGQATGQPFLSPAELDALLRRSAKVARSGNRQGACALLRALRRQYPNDARIRQRLAELEGAEASERATPATPGPVTPGPAADAARVANTPPWLAQRPYLRFAIAGAMFLLLVVIFGVGLNHRRMLWEQSETAGRGGLVAPPLADGPTARPTSSPPPTPTPTPTPPPTPTPTPTPLPRPTVISTGVLLERDGWVATLLRPDYTRLLPDPIDGIVAEGQLALAVLSVGNTAPEPRHIPPDLFALVDGRGRRYWPLPAASSAYLTAYQRGQHGDLALEDAIPPGGALFSLPLLFDVPADTTELFLTMGTPAETGWLILGSAPDPVATPTATPLVPTSPLPDAPADESS